MDQLLGAIVLTLLPFFFCGAFMMFLDKQRDFVLRRELENRRYIKGQE